jgi:ABC-type multidrug transport system permease subunit
MRTVLLMVRKDLLRKVRSPLGIAVALAFPILFASLLGLIWGEGEVPRAHLLVENRDDEFFGNALMSALASDQVAEHFDLEVVGDEGLGRIENDDGSALLRIPEGFSQDLIEGNPTSLELIRNPAQGIMPEVAEQLAAVLAELLSAGSRVLRGPLDRIAPFTRDDATGPTEEIVASVAVAVHGTVEGAEQFLFPPVIELESVDVGEREGEGSSGGAGGRSSSGPGVFSVFLFVFPGVSVYSIFMVGDLAMRDILAEAEAGTLRRQMQGPVGPGTILAAKASYAGVIASIGLVVLAGVGWIALDDKVDPAGFVLLSLAMVVAVTGSGAAIYGASGSQGLGATVSAVIYLFLAFAGGSFIQLDALPRPVQVIAPVSPFYWGTQGFGALVREGAGMTDVLTHVGILGGLGVGLGALGILLLGRRIARGRLA